MNLCLMFYVNLKESLYIFEQIIIVFINIIHLFDLFHDLIIEKTKHEI